MKLIHNLADSLPELVNRSFSRLAQQGFQLGKYLFNRVQVRTIRRQVFKRRASGFNQRLNVGDFIGR